MEVLTKDTFDAAVQKCISSKNYSVLIVTSYRKDHDWIFENWFAEYQSQAASVSRLTSLIQFSHNSSIKMTVNESHMLRGRRADLVLCESWMMQDDNVRANLQVIEASNMLKFKLSK